MALLTLAKGTYWTRSNRPARVMRVGKNIDGETIYQGQIRDMDCVWLSDGTCITHNDNCDLVEVRVVRKRKKA